MSSQPTDRWRVVSDERRTQREHMSTTEADDHSGDLRSPQVSIGRFPFEHVVITHWADDEWASR